MNKADAPESGLQIAVIARQLCAISRHTKGAALIIPCRLLIIVEVEAAAR
jgi:hypothetical protein